MIYNKLIEICEKYETTEQPMTAMTEIRSERDFQHDEGMFISVKISEYSVHMLTFVALNDIQFRFAEPSLNNQSISYSDPHLFDKMESNVRIWFDYATIPKQAAWYGT